MDTKYNIPTSSLVWLSAIIARRGRVPAPVMLPPRITAYRTEDVHAHPSKLTQASTSR